MKNKKNSYESEATNALVEELTKMTTTIYEYVINHTVLSKCDKFFIGDVIREKYNDEYKIDGNGSIILGY